MKIENISPKKLLAYAKNNRKHPEKQVKRIAESINEFGFNQPILIDEKNIIIAGHARTEAALKLGLESVPCIRIEHLTDKQIRAYRILDNKLTSESEWDFEALAPELAELEAEGFDMSIGGLDELESMFPEDIKAVEDDEFEPQEQTETYIKLGDLIELGRHRVLCGDSTDAEQVAELMQGKTASLLLADPPYNVAYEGKTKKALTIENDSMGDKDFREFLFKCFSLCFKNMKEGSSFYIWHADSEGYNFRGAVFDCNEEVRQCLIWVKQTMVMGRQDYQWKHEPCLYGWKKGAAHTWLSDRKQTTVLEF